MTIDAHHHFWHYDPVEYDWIDDSMAVIRRDFLPADLKVAIASAGIDGVVSVQARQTVAETRWLLDLAGTNDFIRGVVGWVPLVSPDVSRVLAEFARHPKLKAVRHVLQGEPDPNYMLRDDFNRGIRELRTFALAYDILIFERHLPQTLAFVDRHPEQRFILDHIAKPRIRDGALSPWRELMQDLARRPNVWCKLSGVVTEADYTTWTEAGFRPYLDATLDAFGPKRIMFGSDWPVCLVACQYQRWAKIVRSFAKPLARDEQTAIMGGNAEIAYRLG
ncbi:MAG: amidohydrolase [Lentisphaerae bacterium RIFOXYB12_FULL_65_16]|nr:MAG: amidohydrolase [Lentisphaerae bacterium RIFOXYA12_64_32]OGV92356.1 MAG: amidohydrolase [Lentisphaerae bacterium RIFOXYB12_FULL_65_16]